MNDLKVVFDSTFVDVDKMDSLLNHISKELEYL